jgi:CRISPR-associated endoribonuclease Cas6
VRIKFRFSSVEPIVIPVQYNHAIQSMIYNNISPELADFLHDQGFLLNGRSFKLFTFSRLRGPFKMRSDGKIEFTSSVELTVASPIERFLRELSEGMLRKADFVLLRQKVFLENASVYPPVDFEKVTDDVKIKMLSPVVAYRSDKERGKTKYYSPWDDTFTELIKKNAEKKHFLLTGQRLENSQFKIIPMKNLDKRYCKILNYKGTVIKGWLGIYKLRGNKRLIETAYDAGLGSKNPQGFGCFEII